MIEPRLVGREPSLRPSVGMAGFSQWFAAGKLGGVTRAANEWLPGSRRSQVLLGGQNAALGGVLFPEGWLTGVFEKDPTVTCNPDTTPLPLLPSPPHTQTTHAATLPTPTHAPTFTQARPMSQHSSPHHAHHGCQGSGLCTMSSPPQALPTPALTKPSNKDELGKMICVEPDLRVSLLLWSPWQPLMRSANMLSGSSWKLPGSCGQLSGAQAVSPSPSSPVISTPAHLQNTDGDSTGSISRRQRSVPSPSPGLSI